MKSRGILFFVTALVVLAALFYSDPDGGLSTGMLIMSLVSGTLAVIMAHFSRKMLAPYVDLERLIQKAAQTSEGAGLACIAVAIVIAALLSVFSPRVRAQDVRTFIPAGAYTYAPVLAGEIQKRWPSHPAPETLAGLVEQESCIHLRHARCWNPKSQLKTHREEGAGMGQITRAYRGDGSLWFDSLADLRRRHMADLSEWNWGNVYERPDLQLRAIVLMSLDNYTALRRVVTDPLQAVAFADAAYNGGLGGVNSERRACALMAGCDPQQWFGHVERTCTKSRAPLYGNRSACDINREHVQLVMRVRSAKYRALMEAV